MKIHQKIILIFILIFIFISACFTFIPIKKYQSNYFKFIKDFRNKPQEHFDKQIEYANYIEQNDELPADLEIKKTNLPSLKKTSRTVEKKMKPKYIRDKNNPNILHPYKKRKFLFFRFY
ncbi:hypothetical protein IJ674_00935 [bacterium]|nr:hypothetical protein [bacterium]